MIWLAVLLAFASAFTVAFSTSLQHRSAGQAPEAVTGWVGLLAHLATRPWWWLGQGLSFLALVLHALALSQGPIAVVQPIAIMGIVFAPPVRAAMSRRLMPAREAGAVVLTFAGIVVFLLATAPEDSTTTQGVGTFTLVAVLTVVAAGVIAAAGRVEDAQTRAFLLGAGAGFLFGMVAVTLKIAVHALGEGGVAGFLGSWATWAFVVLGLWGVAANQMAYRAARLSASMPVLNIVNVLVALTFGYLVFQEVPRHTPLAIVLELAAAAAVGYGLWQLARFEEQHRLEDEKPEQRAATSDAPDRGALRRARHPGPTAS